MRLIAVIISAFFIISAVSLSFGQNVFKYDPKNKRDPFIPLVDKEGNLLPEFRPVTATVELNLEGIVWSDKGESYAIISGVVLRVGEMIGDYTVKKIEHSKVILSRAGEDFTINLRGEEE